MSDWKNRIGSDPWKNLLERESEAVTRIQRDPFQRGGRVQPASEIPKRNEQEAFGYLPLTAADPNPYRRAWLVYQTGRLFLVGAPKAAAEAVAQLAEAGRPRHVVLLSWEPEHVEGLCDLVEQQPRLTIWTSSFIWRETLSQLSRLVSPPRGVERLKNLRLLTAEQVERELENDPPLNLTNAVVVCQQEMDLPLALGVRLSLDYAPSETPALRVVFRCARRRLVIDHLNAAKNAYKLNRIASDLRQQLRVSSALQDELFIRYGKLRELIREEGRDRFLPQIGSDWMTPESEDQWDFPQPVDLTMVGKPIGDVRFESPAPVSTQPTDWPAPLIGSEPEIGEEQAREILSRTVVAILCGGLSAGRARDVLDPGRRLTIPLWDESDDAVEEKKLKGTSVFSILEWRLHQLDRWAQKYGVKLPVLLMTSPETEEIVKAERARFDEAKKANPDQSGHLELFLLSQQLVPRVKVKDGRVAIDESPDGGWRLTARGHLNFLHLLHDWHEREGKQMSRSLCLAIAYNNLGCLFNQRTLTALATIERGGPQFGVELFELDPKTEPAPPSNNDARWKQLSFGGVMDNSWRMFKQAYLASEMPVQSAWYSSHTWYVNLAQSCEWWKGAVENDPQLNRYLFAGKVGEAKPAFPKQDLEQVTHAGGVSVVPIVAPPPHTPGQGLYAHPRFLVARTETDLRNQRFRDHVEAATKQQMQPALPEAPEIQPDDFPVLETVGEDMAYVWGGHRIALFKGRRQQWIAESWDVSTHDLGPAFVYLNWRRPIPLREMLRNLKQSDDGQLSFMAKYLDCHKPLSVQVHPNRSTAGYLSRAGCFDLRDNEGKEESFYVIQAAPSQRFHLYLGFERQSLERLAEQLRPKLLKYAGEPAQWRRPEVQEKCFEELTQTLREGIEGYCRRELAQALRVEKILGMKASEFADEILESFEADRLKPEQQPREQLRLRSVFRYHVTENEDLVNRDLPLTLLGKEYLFAAVGVVRLIALLADFVRRHQGAPEFHRRARALFGDREAVGEGEEAPMELLKHFHEQKMQSGWWVRVPPGTLHAWQGGGNLLIELSHRCDNTFRLLDFGRELAEETNRGMHYWEAMYALSADSILNDQLSQRLVPQLAERRAPPQTASQSQPCHSDFDSRLYPPGLSNKAVTRPAKATEEAGLSTEAVETDWIELAKFDSASSPDWPVLFNPDNPVRLRAYTDTAASPKSRFVEYSLGRCRAVLIKPGVTVEARPAQADDRLLYITPRTKREDLVCISLGASKLETALWRDGESPQIIWHKGKLPPLTKTGEQARQSMIERMAEGLKELFNRRLMSGDSVGSNGKGEGEQRRLRIAVSWPGPIKIESPDETTLYSSIIGQCKESEFKDQIRGSLESVVWGSYALRDVVILNDAEASALGEHRHTRGQLLGEEPGLALNVGSGVCAGFYLPAPELSDEARRFIAAYGAVGRWLFINHLTERWEARLASPKATFSERLQEHVFKERIGLVEGHWLRLSLYLSSRGLALRFLRRVRSSPLFNEALEDAGWKKEALGELLKKPFAEYLEEGYQMVLAQPDEYNIHRMIYQINRQAQEGNSPIAQHFIIDVARELAGVLRQFDAQLEAIVAARQPQEVEEVAAACRACTRRIVLTGAAGEHFGRIPAIGMDDLLIGVLNRCWDNQTDPSRFAVKRSEVAISSVRETEGFIHYLN